MNIFLFVFVFLTGMSILLILGMINYRISVIEEYITGAKNKKKLKMKKIKDYDHEDVSSFNG